MLFESIKLNIKINNSLNECSNLLISENNKHSLYINSLNTITTRNQTSSFFFSRPNFQCF
ncbi:hypothetical protein DDB_G0276653 [Dictyostelium discoideum AX4]|uniref:Uncharacterized protein n=1 Tax=Dictyostelium discoideum TaxID=44689 RepID=Q551C7_DICDI|nr:hypothetical protein DDB_G0276653 [Dictyostelium discoideum AX4]EAL69084.1 hypothetical protein DDB_G0276653 [Dictyostelium discoideum AX4]|eukprot:XP_643011.1 hypothetical protein DDB_G0276653 [Dictyostelium discoideum AX4]